MNKFYKLATATILFFGINVNAQSEFKFLNQGFGTSVLGINDLGIGFSGGAYYNFEDHTLTLKESHVGGIASINNNGDYAGSIFLDQDNFIFQPAFKKDGVWNPIPWFEESDPSNSQFTVYKISENGLWVVGQMSIGAADYGIFAFNTQTNEMKQLMGGDFEDYSAYSINNNGIIVGWGDLPQEGTQRVPIWLDVNDMIPHQIVESVNILNGANAINNHNIIVGDNNGQPFIYKKDTNEFRLLEKPAGAVTASFVAISDTNIMVGYAGMGGNSRKAIIYHESMGDTPIYISDWMAENGIENTSTDSTLGTAATISQNGKYIGGFNNATMAAFAQGWVLYLDDLLLNTSSIEKSKISFYPNPVQNELRIQTNENINSVEVYDINGNMVYRYKHILNNSIDLSQLKAGVYVIKANIGQKIHTEKIIKK
ncbi:MAG TPA: T9SS type A sorting domain-containing protein [Faecalibacter sp.]